MGGRAAAYPVSVFIVPLVWWVMRRRGSHARYPYAVDILIVLPFFIDTLGNALNLYDTISWWDDANHFVNWAILTGGFAALLSRTRLNAWTTFGLVVGFGAATAIVWELVEYITFIRNSPELDTAYHDTLGDLALGLSGSVLTGVIAALLVRRRRTA
jgi:hypothetical protein